MESHRFVEATLPL